MFNSGDGRVTGSPVVKGSRRGGLLQNLLFQWFESGYCPFVLQVAMARV